ncbi:MAG: protein-disulfide reductase DsbD family protein [Rhodospirillales bacterium]
MTPRFSRIVHGFLAITAALSCFAPALAAATPDAASDWQDNAYTSVRLIAAQDGTGDGSRLDALRFGLEFRMPEHWKIYWRSPGDAGYPPQPDWDNSENVASVDIGWPAPTRFSVLGLETLGYENGVVLPLRVVPSAAGEAVRLAASVDYLTCSDICVPESASLSLELPAGGGAITRQAHLIDRFRALVPGDGAAHGLRIEVPSFSSEGTPTLMVDAASTSGMAFHQPDIYVEGPSHLSFGKPDVTLMDGATIAHFRIPVYATKPSDIALADETVTLTLVDGNRSAEAARPVSAANVAGTPSASGFSLTILGLAFLGGLILNLMPCVLPVLAIKLAGVLGKAGAARGAVRRGFLATSAGIVVSFLMLAAALVALKLGGLAIGWGIQFQQPAFLAVMAAVVTLFACNLWGLFEIHAPAVVGTLGGPVRPAHETPLGGHFLTGMLATLLATPCSAPFLGTAIGFALARGPVEIFVIFAVVGIGLATPYMLVAAMPDLARALPKPGPWMIVLKRVLALALAGTAVWLLNVIAATTGWPVSVASGFALAAACFGLWILRRRSDVRAPSIKAATAMVLAVSILLPALSPHTGRPPGAKDDDRWQRFDQVSIERLVGQGQTVVVDVTADWCLTCKVNKTVAFGDPAVAEQLGSDDVTAMVADWTLPDPAITTYLASYERFGIPFNAVYGPAAPEGIVLPELLRAGDVLDAINRARGG